MAAQVAVVTGRRPRPRRAKARLLAQQWTRCVRETMLCMPDAARRWLPRIATAGEGISRRRQPLPVGRGRAMRRSRRRGHGSGDHPGNNVGGLAGTVETYDAEQSTHAQSKTWTADQCHAGSDGELRRGVGGSQCGHDRGARHRVMGKCIYAAKKARWVIHAGFALEIGQHGTRERRGAQLLRTDDAARTRSRTGRGRRTLSRTAIEGPIGAT